MTTLFCDKLTGKIFRWNDKSIESKTINYGDPLSLEYVKIRLVTNKFNFFRKNRIMVIDNIKSNQTKEIMSDSITYYDDNVLPKKFTDGNPNKYFDIEEFDPTKYGCPYFYYTPSYQNNGIVFTTRIFKIDSDDMAQKLFNCLHNIFTVGSKIPNYGLLCQLADNIVIDASDMLTKLFDGGKQLTNNHVINFEYDNEDKKIYIGYYLCLPNVLEPQNIDKIISNFRIEDQKLIRINSKGDKVEFGDTYYLIELKNIKRIDLNDFDYSASSNELLLSLKKSDDHGVEKFSKITKDASDMDLIKQIFELYSKDDKNSVEIKNLYNHLHDKNWFKMNFPKISDIIFK